MHRNLVLDLEIGYIFTFEFHLTHGCRCKQPVRARDIFLLLKI